MGDTEKRPNQYRSALQLLPQGEDGATLTMMFKNDHVSPPVAGVGTEPINSLAGRENQFAADQTR